MNESIDERAVVLDIAFNSFMGVFYGITVIIFIFVVLLMFAARSLFHPLFCLLFTLIIVEYITCTILAIILLGLVATNLGNSQAMTIVGTTYQAVYVYLACTVAYCVLERASATVLSKTYEFRRNWFLMLLGQVVAGVVVVAHVYVYRLGGIVSDVVQFALSCVILTSLAVLLFVNYRLRISTRGASLSCRYQILENIRALKLVTPVVLLDTTITAVDIIGAQFFKVRPAFEKNVYKSEPNYLPAYIVFRMAALILQYAITIVIIRHETLRKIAADYLSKLIGRPICAQVGEVQDKRVQTEASQAAYFNYLHSQWI